MDVAVTVLVTVKVLVIPVRVTVVLAIVEDAPGDVVVLDNVAVARDELERVVDVGMSSDSSAVGRVGVGSFLGLDVDVGVGSSDSVQVLVSDLEVRVLEDVEGRDIRVVIVVVTVVVVVVGVSDGA